jgi:hypothetical protein
MQRGTCRSRAPRCTPHLQSCDFASAACLASSSIRRRVASMMIWQRVAVCNRALAPPSSTDQLILSARPCPPGPGALVSPAQLPCLARPSTTGGPHSRGVGHSRGSAHTPAAAAVRLHTQPLGHRTCGPGGRGGGPCVLRRAAPLPFPRGAPALACRSPGPPPPPSRRPSPRVPAGRPQQQAPGPVGLQPSHAWWVVVTRSGVYQTLTLRHTSLPRRRPLLPGARRHPCLGNRVQGGGGEGRGEGVHAHQLLGPLRAGPPAGPRAGPHGHDERGQQLPRRPTS